MEHQKFILHCSFTTDIIDSSQVGKPQDVMSIEEGTILLSQDIHRYAQQTYAHLYACNNDENLANAACKYPVKRKIGQNERKHVLEDEKACESFDSKLPMSIHN